MLPKIIRTGYAGCGQGGGNPPSPYLVGQRCDLSNRPDSLQMPRHIQEGRGWRHHRFSRKKKDQVDFHRAYCKGKQKRAEAILMDARRNFNPEEPKVMNGDILFADYMEKWLDIIKSSVAVPTFASYSTTVKKIVAPYFREKEVTLKNLTAMDIQEF